MLDVSELVLGGVKLVEWRGKQKSWHLETSTVLQNPLPAHLPPHLGALAFP